MKDQDGPYYISLHQCSFDLERDDSPAPLSIRVLFVAMVRQSCISDFQTVKVEGRKKYSRCSQSETAMLFRLFSLAGTKSTNAYPQETSGYPLGPASTLGGL